MTDNENIPWKIGDTVYIKPDVADFHTSYSKGSYVWVRGREKWLDNNPHKITSILKSGEIILDNDNRLFWVSDDFYAYRPYEDEAKIPNNINIDDFEEKIMEGNVRHFHAEDFSYKSTFSTTELNNYLRGSEGKTFYHVMFGNVTLKKVTQEQIIVIDCSNTKHTLRADGRYNEYGDVVLFPSAVQRDWLAWWIDNRTNIEYCPYKTWSDYATTLDRVPVIGTVGGLTKWIYEDQDTMPVFEKAGLALIKLLHLIGNCYGGIVTPIEWNDPKAKFYTICCNSHTNELFITKANTQTPLAFHTKGQAKEFTQYPENKKLLMDYFTSARTISLDY